MKTPPKHAKVLKYDPKAMEHLRDASADAQEIGKKADRGVEGVTHAQAAKAHADVASAAEKSDHPRAKAFADMHKQWAKAYETKSGHGAGGQR